MNEIINEMEGNFGCAAFQTNLQLFAMNFMSYAIENYMAHNDLDKENKEHQAEMLEMAIHATKKAAQRAFELCNDCIDNISNVH